MRTLLLITLLATACKDHQPSQPPAASAPAPTPAPAQAPPAPPPPAPPPSTGTLELPAAPTAELDPADAKVTFPKETPAIVVWRGGGGDKPRTEISVRVWSDGSVRFRCGRRGSLPRERVAAFVDAFVRAGWNTAHATPADESVIDCVTTTVQVTQGSVTHVRRSSCESTPADIARAVKFVETVVGPDPCT